MPASFKHFLSFQILFRSSHLGLMPTPITSLISSLVCSIYTSPFQQLPAKTNCCSPHNHSVPDPFLLYLSLVFFLSASSLSWFVCFLYLPVCCQTVPYILQANLIKPHTVLSQRFTFKSKHLPKTLLEKQQINAKRCCSRFMLPQPYTGL